MNTVAKTIAQTFEQKNYRFFDSGRKFNLNIFGVRNNGPVNTFSDFLCVLYRNEWNEWQLYQWPGTTKPGGPALRMPRNVKGTGIMVPDQYLGAYCIDKHNGQYDALCQRLGKVRAYRDNDRDNAFDLDPATIEEDFFGANIHKALRDTPEVNEWSYLCQVFKRDSDFNRFMAIVNFAAKEWGNKFSYTLLEQHDFNQRL
jgi:hypothetical protein